MLFLVFREVHEIPQQKCLHHGTYPRTYTGFESSASWLTRACKMSAGQVEVIPDLAGHGPSNRK